MSTVENMMPGYSLTEEQLAVRELCRELSEKYIAPRAHDIDATAEFPQDVRQVLAEHDVLALPFDEAYGGTGTGTLAMLVAIEEISKACATSGLILAVQELGSLPIKLDGTEEQKQRWLPRLASGEWLPAYALTEPESGSDSAAMRTTAERQGDEWVLNGTKRFITNGGIADIYVVFAKTDPSEKHRGISAFVVEKDAPGFSVGKLEKKMGIKGSTTAELHFDDCRIPAGNLLGEEGNGFSLAMRVLDRSRPGIAAQALGIAEGALEYAGRYLLEREQFGRPIADFQGLQFMLADMRTKCCAAQELLYRTGWLIDAGAPREQLTHYSAMAKLFCSDVAMEVTTDAVQLLGGYGYISEYPVERMMRDAKITQLYEGTNQVQRIVIAKGLLKELAATAQ